MGSKAKAELDLDELDVREGESYADWLLRALWRAYFDARKSKRFTQDESKFELNELENLVRLRDSILERKYRPGKGVAFIVYDPVMREIFAAPFRDRIVHHLICNIVGKWWERRLIYDSYSCRKGKGTLFGAQRLAHHIQGATQNYQDMEWYVVKLDIKGYFMSMSRDQLYERIMWGLRQQFRDVGFGNGASGDETSVDEMSGGEALIRRRIAATAAFLWQQVIFDDPTLHVEKRGSEREWSKLARDKSLFKQKPRTGMAIGNYSSQMLSNIFLDQLDRFIVYELGYKRYGRYVDDFYVLVPAKKIARFMTVEIPRIEQFLKLKRLTLHPRKRYVQPVEKGVTFVGVKVYPGRLLPGARVIRRFRRMAWLVQAGAEEPEKMVTYMGHICHLRWKKTAERVFRGRGFVFRH